MGGCDDSCPAFQIEVDEETLSPEEQKDRKIMKFLLKIKNGTPPMRKVGVVETVILRWHRWLCIGWCCVLQF